MRVLFLGLPDSPLLGFLEEREEFVEQTMEPLTLSFLDGKNFGFLVSYRYRHILKPEALNFFPDAAINLHPSLLPWNRGADSNLWSFIDDTPKGVTIHHLDEGVDSGDIIVQKEVDLDEDGTLASSYEKLQKEIQSLFMQNWEKMRRGNCDRRMQPSGGSCHRLKDREKVSHLLTEGWNTSLRALVHGLREAGLEPPAEAP